MNFKQIKNLKGFMPDHEGVALFKWAEKFSALGPILEIGTYCGKSSMYLSLGAKKNDQYVFTIDHHLGSEEHQINEEYFDDETYDHNNKRVNTLPLLIENINQCKAKNIVPIVADSKEISSNWISNIGMLFIDGGHSYESANNDYKYWESKIITGGCLVLLVNSLYISIRYFWTWRSCVCFQMRGFQGARVETSTKVLKAWDNKSDFYWAPKIKPMTGTTTTT